MKTEPTATDIVAATLFRLVDGMREWDSIARTWHRVTEGHSYYGAALQDFANNVPQTTTLTDPAGRKVTAKVVNVDLHDGQVDVTFEFDPNAWVMVH